MIRSDRYEQWDRDQEEDDQAVPSDPGPVDPAFSTDAESFDAVGLAPGREDLRFRRDGKYRWHAVGSQVTGALQAEDRVLGAMLLIAVDDQPNAA